MCQLAWGSGVAAALNNRISDAQRAHVFVGVGTHSAGESKTLAAAFDAAGFRALDLSGDETAKEPVRDRIGGSSTLAHDERLLHFSCPERPGALMKFLTLMLPSWNISLFHYRNQGADEGHVLVGIQAPAADEAALQEFLRTLGYPYTDETSNPAYRLFLAG